MAPHLSPLRRGGGTHTAAGPTRAPRDAQDRRTSMNGHTKGPWRVCGCAQETETHVTAEGNAHPWTIAKVFGHDEENKVANAALIADAPAMRADLAARMAELDAANL